MRKLSIVERHTSTGMSVMLYLQTQISLRRERRVRCDAMPVASPEGKHRSQRVTIPILLTIISSGYCVFERNICAEDSFRENMNRLITFGITLNGCREPLAPSNIFD